MIELAERPADTAPPSPQSGWYDPDSSAFEPLAGSATTDEVTAGLEPAATGDPDAAARVAFEAP